MNFFAFSKDMETIKRKISKTEEDIAYIKESIVTKFDSIDLLLKNLQPPPQKAQDQKIDGQVMLQNLT